MEIGFITNGIRAGYRHSDLMELSIWIQGFMINYWHAYYKKNSVKNVKVHQLVHLESYIWKYEANCITEMQKYMHEEWNFVGSLTRWYV